MKLSQVLEEINPGTKLDRVIREFPAVELRLRSFLIRDNRAAAMHVYSVIQKNYPGNVCSRYVLKYLHVIRTLLSTYIQLFLPCGFVHVWVTRDLKGWEQILLLPFQVEISSKTYFVEVHKHMEIDIYQRII